MNNSWQRYLIHLLIILILGSYGFTKMATLDAITFKYHVQFEKRLDKMEEITMRIPLMDAKLDLLLKQNGLRLGRNR